MQPRRHRRVGAAPARHDDGAGALDEREAAVGLDADAAGGAQRPGLDGGDAEAIPVARPSPAGRGRRSRPPRRTRRCTARRRRAPPRAGSAAAAVSVCALARSLRSLAFAPLVARGRAVSNPASRAASRAASSDRRADHAEPCHLHAARAALRGGRALRAQAGLRDRLLGRAREPRRPRARFRAARRARAPPPTPRRTCPVPSACRIARSRPSA